MQGTTTTSIVLTCTVSYTPIIVSLLCFTIWLVTVNARPTFTLFHFHPTSDYQLNTWPPRARQIARVTLFPNRCGFTEHGTGLWGYEGLARDGCHQQRVKPKFGQYPARLHNFKLCSFNLYPFTPRCTSDKVPAHLDIITFNCHCFY